MKVFVLGGTGFVGRHIVQRLHDDGHQIVVFHRGQTCGELPPAVRTILGDRRELTTFSREFPRFGPDVVIDVIPYTEQEARAVMASFRGITRRVIALSSGDVYRNYDGLRRIGIVPPNPCPLSEDAPLREHLYPYRAQAADAADRRFDYKKILVERVVLGDPDLPGTVLRLPMVYGPGDSQHRLLPYLKRMDDRRPAILMPKGQAGWRWTRGYVENVAAAVVHAATDDRAIGQVYNVGDASASTEAEWVLRIGRAIGWDGALVPLPSAQLPAAMAPDLDWRYDLETETNRLRQHLGFADPVALDEGLRRSITWERAHAAGAALSGTLDDAAEGAALAIAGRDAR
jgi:nucleoside-diphosphate-sugar epimerase